MDLTSSQLNKAAISGSLGMYLLVPLVGYIADRFGVRLLSLCAGVFFGLGYFLAASAVEATDRLDILIFGYFLIGIGTCTSYFSGLVSCVKIAGPNSPVLGVALPIALFGLSPFWIAQVASSPLYRDKEVGGINVPFLFNSLSLLLFVVGGIGAFFLNPIHDPKPSHQSYPDDHETDEAAVNERTALVQQRGRSISVGSDSTFKHHRPFFAEWTLYAFALAIFINFGVGEMFINNLGTFIETLPSSQISVSTGVSLLSLSSTVSRLSCGVLCEKFNKKIPLLLILVGCISPISFFALAFIPADLLVYSIYFFIVSIGAAYGGVFTIVPTLVSEIWGVTWFGRNWGILIWFSALGTISFSQVFAWVYDTHASDTLSKSCYGKECYFTTFVLAGTASTFGVVLWLVVWHVGWKKKEWI